MSDQLNRNLSAFQQRVTESQNMQSFGRAVSAIALTVAEAMCGADNIASNISI